MVRLLRPLFAALLAMIASAHAQPASPIGPDIGARVVEKFVVPVLGDFRDASRGMEADVAALCDRPSVGALDKARTSFAHLVPTWGRASVLRFGPLQAANRFERIFFWPDARGVTLRQVQAALAEEDPTLVDAASLAAKSVALQGLPALEFLLFGTGSETLAGQGGFRCRYALAIAANVAAMAGDISAGWAAPAPFHASFTAPAPERDPYRTTGEVAGEIVKAIGTTLQFARAAELLPALGETIDDARGRRAPFWRSDMTFAFVGAQIGGLIDLIEATGFTDADDALVGDLARSMRFDLSNGRAALAGIGIAAEQAFGDEDARGRIAFAAITLEGANQTLSERFSAAIGLTMGFNALDGD